MSPECRPKCRDATVTDRFAHQDLCATVQRQHSCSQSEVHGVWRGRVDLERWREGL